MSQKQQDKGASSGEDRATHEQSPQAVSAVPVGIPSAEKYVWLAVWRGALQAFDDLLPQDGEEADIAAAQHLFECFGNLASNEDFQAERKRAWLLWQDKTSLRLELAAVQAKYNELLFAVGSCFPGETRHETALRYINERENASPIAAQGMSAGTAETAQQAQGDARQPGPKDAPERNHP